MTSRLPNPFDEPADPADETANPFDAAAEPDPDVADDDPADALVGRTIAGRYRITGVLGRGGMGIVYSGEHLELERPVAVKVLPGMFSRDSEVLKRFEREARTASKVAHENVVTVYDYGRLDTGEPYLIMERLTGRDLDVVLAEKRRFNAKEAIEVLVPLASALDAMHAQGVVHRDIKPSNVFFTSKGTVKLVDFGLAVLRQTGERLTQTGSVVGTAEYMAPEAARGALVDARGDVYSLATLAFEILTGVMPFSGAPVQVLIEKVSHDPPRLSDVCELRFSAETERVVAAALSRKPEHRPASAGELVAALRTALEASPPVPGARAGSPVAVGAGQGGSIAARAASQPASRPPPPSTEIAARLPGERRAGPWIAAAVLLLLALGGGGAALLSGAGAGDGAPAATDDGVAAGTGAIPVVPGPTLEVPAPPAPSGPAVGIDPPAVEPVPAIAAAPAEPSRRARAARSATAREPAAAEPVAAAEPAPSPAAAAAGEPREPAADTTIRGDAIAADEGGAERAAALVRDAQSALLRGELPRARELYREATGASPRNAAAWRGLGLASERLHLEPEAVQAYERYLRVAPNAADADAIRERIARLSGG